MYGDRPSRGEDSPESGRDEGDLEPSERPLLDHDPLPIGTVDADHLRHALHLQQTDDSKVVVLRLLRALLSPFLRDPVLLPRVAAGELPLLGNENTTKTIFVQVMLHLLVKEVPEAVVDDPSSFNGIMHGPIEGPSLEELRQLLDGVVATPVVRLTTGQVNQLSG